MFPLRDNVSRTHTPKAQWWAEQLGRRLVYIVLTLFLVVPAWVATRQHLANAGDGAPLDVPVDLSGKATQAQPQPSTPRTVVASMAPVAAPAPETRFTIAVIPDTQNYMDYTHQKAEGFAFDASEMFIPKEKDTKKKPSTEG